MLFFLLPHCFTDIRYTNTIPQICWPHSCRTSCSVSTSLSVYILCGIDMSYNISTSPFYYSWILQYYINNIILCVHACIHCFCPSLPSLWFPRPSHWILFFSCLRLDSKVLLLQAHPVCGYKKIQQAWKLWWYLKQLRMKSRHVLKKHGHGFRANSEALLSDQKEIVWDG